LWASGRIKDGGLCRVHLRTVRKPGADVERARLKLAQSAPFAVDVLEDLMENAESEPVKLKAASEILDRAGIKGGYEFDVNVEVTDGRTAASVISERLERLAAGARTMIQIINPDILEAEAVVGEDGQTVHVVRESGKNFETDETEEAASHE
jgi:hypothetical protein